MSTKTNKCVSTEYFLNEIHGLNAQIYFNVDNKTWKDRPQTYQQAQSKLRWLNSLGKDICFIVNSGSSKDRYISRINSAFADWDCGKDSNGNYFPIDIVSDYKSLFLPKIYDCPISFSFLVETRNGFHPYWLLYPGATKEQFIELQRRIAHYLGGDSKVCNPARAMRLPGYKWIKSHSGCDPFDVRIIDYNDVRYSISELFSFFPPVSDVFSSSIVPLSSTFCRLSHFLRGVNLGKLGLRAVSV